MYKVFEVVVLEDKVVLEDINESLNVVKIKRLRVSILEIYNRYKWIFVS